MIIVIVLLLSDGMMVFFEIFHSRAFSLISADYYRINMCVQGLHQSTVLVHFMMGEQLHIMHQVENLYKVLQMNYIVTRQPNKIIA